MRHDIKTINTYILADLIFNLEIKYYSDENISVSLSNPSGRNPHEIRIDNYKSLKLPDHKPMEAFKKDIKYRPPYIQNDFKNHLFPLPKFLYEMIFSDNEHS